MDGFFSVDGPLMRALSRFAQLLALSVLWIVCSVPWITAGASTAALYTVTLRMVRGEEGKVASGFFRAWRENFCQATLIHLLLTVLAAALLLYGQAAALFTGGAGLFFTGAGALMWLLWLMEALFVYPAQARFANPLPVTVKNAWLMAAGNVPVLLGVFLITGLPAWTLLLNTELLIRTLPLWLLAGPGLIAWLNSFLFAKCFQRYIPEQNETGE
ncbi:MAG: YesL family protein [Eubacteriales bacterium]|nr:YesL family protein [Eubacteriales bacterium]